MCSFTLDAFILELSYDATRQGLGDFRLQRLAILGSVDRAKDDARQPDWLEQVGQQRALDAESAVSSDLVRARERVSDGRVRPARLCPKRACAGVACSASEGACSGSGGYLDQVWRRCSCRGRYLEGSHRWVVEELLAGQVRCRGFAAWELRKGARLRARAGQRPEEIRQT